MAGAGKKTFTAGETLTASDVNSYLMEQSVMVFGGTAARSSAIPTPSEGMTTYRTDTQQIESYDGAEWRGMSGLQLVKKQTIGSAVSSVTVTGAFSATYENYKILISGGAGSQTASLHLQLGATTSGYTFAIGYIPYATGTPSSFSSSNSGAKFLDVGGFSTQNNNFNVDLHSPFASKQTMMVTQMAYTGVGSVWGGGSQNSTTSFTDFTITTGAGTITGGTIYVYGYGT